MKELPSFPDDSFLLESAVNSANDGLVIADAGRPDCPVIYVNPAFTDITGYTFDEAVGKNCRFLQGEMSDQAELETLRSCLVAGTDCRVTLRNFRKDGTPFWNELHIAPIRQGDSVRYFVGVQADVTKRIEAEKRSRELQASLESRNRELQDLNRTKNEFLGMAAHDLRNPLAAIVMTAEALEKYILKDGTPEQKEPLTRIQEAAEHMLELINGLLDVSQIEAGRLKLQREQVSLLELVVKCIAIHRPRAEEKGIELTADFKVNDAVTISLDGHKVRQVVENMLTNALKYSPSGARITVTVEADERETRISVTDTGQGIAEEELDHIFKPFGRAKSTATTDGEPSNGLGLAICSKIVEAHGWSIAVQSRLGCGSTFTVRIPQAPSASSPHA